MEFVRSRLPDWELPSLAYGFLGLSLISLIGVALDVSVLVFLPLILLAGLGCLYDVRIPFYLLFACIPLSWEQELAYGFGTDLPTEPLMMFLLGATFLFLLKNMSTISAKVFLHPITLFLLAHYSWTWASAIFSENIFVSVKFGLAKTWYVAVFYLLAILLMRKVKDFEKLFHVVIWPLTIVTIIILVNHAQKGFSFESANFVMAPFFRNHVTSAALMSVVVPFIGYLWWKNDHFLLRSALTVSMLVILAGIYFSYTRAAYLAVIMSLAVFPILYFRLMKPVLGMAVVVVVLFVQTMVHDNTYLRYSPNYDTTISHNTFEDLVSATYKGTDISTMERVYRWVAGYGMVVEKPWMGFGPGNFYNYYKGYTLTLFKTYVSDNPEKSGIHCYYLMILIEQGFIGLLILVALIFVVLLMMENLYHRLKDERDRAVVMATTMCFVIILLFQVINDLIETDKMGPFFFLCMAITVVMDLKSRGYSALNKNEEGIA